MKKRSGYTLLELLTSLALLSLIILASYHLFFTVLSGKETISEAMNHKDLIVNNLEKILIQDDFKDVCDIFEVSYENDISKEYTSVDFEALKENQKLEIDIFPNSDYSGSFISYDVEGETNIPEYDYEIDIKKSNNGSITQNGNKININLKYNSHFFSKVLHFRFNWWNTSNNNFHIETNDWWPLQKTIINSKSPLYIKINVDEDITDSYLLQLSFYNYSTNNELIYIYTEYDDIVNYQPITILTNQSSSTTKKYQYKIEYKLYEDNKLLDVWTAYHFWKKV
jgi:prepilin-type N-terminal cleavage/methylation domain-containing protein